MISRSAYGQRPNSELLLYSGFVDFEHPEDYFKLEMSVNSNDPTAKARSDFALKLGFQLYHHSP